MIKEVVHILIKVSRALILCSTSFFQGEMVMVKIIVLQVKYLKYNIQSFMASKTCYYNNRLLCKSNNYQY